MQGSEDSGTDSKSPVRDEDNQKLSSLSPEASLLQHDNIRGDDLLNKCTNNSEEQARESHAPLGNPPAETSSEYKLACDSASSCIKKSTTMSSKAVRSTSRPTWGRTSVSMDISSTLTLLSAIGFLVVVTGFYLYSFILFCTPFMHVRGVLGGQKKKVGH